MPCCHHLETLNNFVLELVFCKWSPTGQWHLHEERGTCEVCICHSSCLSHLHIAVLMPRSTEFQWTHPTRESARLQGSTTLLAPYLHDWVSRDMGSLGRLITLFKPQPAWKIGRRQCCWKKHKRPRAPILSFLTSLCKSTVMLKTMH